MKKFCVKCGKPFDAIGREVICPDCKAQAAEDAKKAAVLKAKKASWAGESVPVRISGRASTLIRKYGEANNMTFAESLDELLKNTPFFTSLGIEWSTIVPYKSRRRDKATSTTENKQEAPQEAQAAKQEEVKQDAPQASKPQEVTKAVQAAQEAKQAARVTKPATASKASASKAVKAVKKGEEKE